MNSWTASPLKIKIIAESRVKNDDVDSEILAELLRNDWIQESYVPSKEIREMRRIVRTRIQISRTVRSYKNHIRYELLRMHVYCGTNALCSSDVYMIIYNMPV